MLSIPVYLCVGQIKSGSVRIMGIALGCSADGNQKEKHRHEPIASHRAGAGESLRLPAQGPCVPTLQRNGHYHITVTALDVDRSGLDRTASAVYMGFAIGAHAIARAFIVCPTAAGEERGER
jgi:phosphatidylethanolamine-binding protein (PEBP) family uncharacterized protein